jgi:hypothetical protein
MNFTRVHTPPGMDPRHQGITIEKDHIGPHCPAPLVGPREEQVSVLWFVARAATTTVSALQLMSDTRVPGRPRCRPQVLPGEVGVGGLEPPTPASQTRCAANCATPRRGGV